MTGREEQGYQDVLAWLAALAPDAEIHWRDDHVEVEGCFTGWVDVQIPELEQAARMNWIWTILSPDDPDAGVADGWDTLIVPQDRDCYGVWDPEGHDYVVQVTCGKGETPTVEQTAALTAALDGHPDRQLATSGAWTKEILSFALASWVASEVSRTDLSFVYDDSLPLSGLHQEAVEASERLRSGEEETYQLGEHVRASGQVMDMLLDQPPEDAAEITQALNELAAQHRPPEEPS